MTTGISEDRRQQAWRHDNQRGRDGWRCQVWVWVGNDTTAESRARVTSRVAVREIALTKVILAGVNLYKTQHRQTTDLYL